MSARRPAVALPVAILLTLAWALSAQRARAQQPARAPAGAPATVVVQGWVTDTLGTPIPGATVELDDGLQIVATDDQGRFVFRGVPTSGVFLVAARRIGFLPIKATVYPDSSGGVTAILQLYPAGQELSRVLVEAKRATGIASFERNRTSGQGTYLDRAEIQAKQPTLVSDLVRGVLGFETRAERGGLVVLNRTRGGETCQPAIVVDGLPRAVAGPGDFDNLLPVPQQIAAIEFYRQPNRTPGEYLLNRQAWTCGTIVIWTLPQASQEYAKPAPPPKPAP